MAQGTRRRLLMAATAGFGIVLCAGLAGCQNTDKSKDTKAAPKPAPGLYGTPTLNGTNSTTSTAKTQPNYGAQPNPPVQQTSGAQVPGQGLGAGQPPYAQSQFGSNGNNTLNTPALPQNYNSTPGGISPINAPVKPGTTYNSTGGPVGMSLPPSMATNPGGPLTAAHTPPAPQLTDMPLQPLPPPPPGTSLAGAPAGTIAPPSPIPATLSTTGPGPIAQPSSTAFSSAGVLPISPP